MFGKIGVTAMGGDSKAVIDKIIRFENFGIKAAWLTTGGAGIDGLTIFAAAAMATKSILLGTCITPTYPRHPITTVQQVQVINQLAPGRFRLGLGPSHKVSIEATYGIDHVAPLTNLREYIFIVRAMLEKGEVEFDGKQYHAHARVMGEPNLGIPIMASALRAKSFELCGEISDGAISWVCPGTYLRDVALPAMKIGAAKVDRAVPPLIVHAPICVHDDIDQVRKAVREQLSNYPKSPFYQQMFIRSGHPEATEGIWSDEMIDDVVLMGDESLVSNQLERLFEWGADEIIAHPLLAGSNPSQSLDRTLALISSLS
jgi:F420-dependent oxidoreductase-like protein